MYSPNEGVAHHHGHATIHGLRGLSPYCQRLLRAISQHFFRKLLTPNRSMALAARQIRAFSDIFVLSGYCKGKIEEIQRIFSGNAVEALRKLF